MKKLILILLILACYQVSAQVPGTWTSYGIGGGGALFSPSINPLDHNEIFMGCDMSDLFHTTDGGTTWTNVNFLQLQGGHDAEMQYTSDPSMRYVVDYTSIEGMDYIRPMKSTDGGSTWQVISGNPYPLQPNGGILRLIADYDNPGHLVIADYGTIYFSSDGGASFHQVHTCLDNGSGNHIAGVFWDGANIFIGTNDGLLVSTNTGLTFTTMSVTGIPSGQYILSFSGAKQNSTTRFICLTAANVWAGNTYGDNYWNAMKGIYFMDNASGTWGLMTTGITTGTDFPVFAGMAANNKDVAYIAGGSDSGNPIVMKSVSGGAWTHVFLTSSNQNIYTGWCGSGGDHQWSYAEAPFGFTVARNDANTVALTDYSDMHLTADGGATWYQKYLDPATQNPMGSNTPKEKQYHGNGMENTSCWQILWTDSLHLFAGFSDYNGIMSDDKGVQWKFIPGLTQNSVYRIVQHPNRILYASTSSVHDLYQSTRVYDSQINAGTGAVWYSTDHGNSFTLLHNFSHPVIWIALDPSDSERMYAAVLHSNKVTTGGIYVTTNLSAGASASWTKMPNPDAANGHPYNINVLNNQDLVVSYSARKPNYSSAFTDSSGVFYYQFSTSTWFKRSDANMRFWTMDVTVDPNDASQSTWYASVFTGWGTSGISGTGGLYRTTDKGISWFRVSSSYRVNSCTVAPGNANELYFTTETDGLWMSQDATATSPDFTHVTTYPFRHPMRVFYNPWKLSEIWVSSFGNGMRAGIKGSSNGIAPVTRDVLRVTIYPNPCTRYLHLNFSSVPLGILSLELFDLTGRRLLVLPLKNTASQEMTLPELSDGVYFYQISCNQLSVQKGKIIIDRE